MVSNDFEVNIWFSFVCSAFAANNYHRWNIFWVFFSANILSRQTPKTKIYKRFHNVFLLSIYGTKTRSHLYQFFFVVDRRNKNTFQTYIYFVWQWLTNNFIFFSFFNFKKCVCTTFPMNATQNNGKFLKCLKIWFQMWLQLKSVISLLKAGACLICNWFIINSQWIVN